MKQIYFHRAIFLSWYCSKGDCKFCYMSTQKNKIKNPKLARRTKESILAEVYLCKLFNWKIEFLSGGYDSYEWPELVQLIKEIKEIHKEKLWLNLGTLKKHELEELLPYIKGVSGPIECINPKLRKKICPSKPMKDITEMFKAADDLNLKKSITIILGLGETLDDFKYLINIINEYKIDQITFYRLKHQKETIYENTKPITKEYFAKWIKLTKTNFPKIKIIAGSWLTHIDEISSLLKAGADGITKFPSIRKFNSKYAKMIEKEVVKANMQFRSNLTRKKTIKVKDNKTQEKIDSYLNRLK